MGLTKNGDMTTLCRLLFPERVDISVISAVPPSSPSHHPPQGGRDQHLSTGRGIIRNCRSTNITSLPILPETKQTYYFDLLSYLNLQTSVPNQCQLPNHLSTIFCHHRRLKKNPRDEQHRITKDRLVEALLLD